MKNYKKTSQSGFTIIELTLAMTMLSILLVIILMSILNITATYNKGITLKRVNQSGRTIATELQTNLRKSNPSNVITRSNMSIATVPVVTRLCTGHDSFIWSVYGDSSDAPAIEKYDDDSTISMAQVKDPGSSYCKDPYPRPEKSKNKNLLGDDLVMRQPVKVDTSVAPATDTEGRLIKFTFTISTPDDDSIIVGGSCQGGRGDDFCALNTFVVTSYAKGI